MQADNLFAWKKVLWDLIRCQSAFVSMGRETWRSRGLRIMPVDNYCELYISDEKKAVVTIIRVMYGGRDMDVQLNKYTRVLEK